MKLNVTAICTLDQVRDVAAGAARAARPSVVSVFAGRIADTGRDPIPLMTRGAGDLPRRRHAHRAAVGEPARAAEHRPGGGASAATSSPVTPDLLKKLELVGKDLADFSLETVQMFYRDAEAAGFKL